MITVRSHYSLLHTIARDSTSLPDLKPEIQRHHGKRIRRIDRYIQLCLAGGLNCVAGRTLPVDTGVYLATRAGAITTSAATMSRIECEGELPKPLHFVNTLGNSAGFYLTQLLAIEGATLLVSDEHLSFEAALSHACLDLQAGVVNTVLVGGFDEVPLPPSGQLERLDAPPDTPALYEGSHWLLLESAADNTCSSLSAPHYLPHGDSLEQWLVQQHLPLQLCFTPTATERDCLSRYAPGYTVAAPEAEPHGVYSGAAMLQLLAGTNSAIHLARGGSGYAAVTYAANTR